MDQALNILLQVLFMLGVALLYYFFQRRRIMKHEKIEIAHIIDEFINDHSEYEQAKEYLNNLQEANEQRNYSKLLELVIAPDSHLPEDSKNFIRDIDNRLEFLIKSSRQ